MVFRTLGAASLMVVAATMGHAEEPLTAPLPFERVDTPEDAAAIPLYAGDAPGSEGSTLEEVWRNAGTERWANNVTRPTLLPVWPDDPDATRAAVIVVPGGGFQFISMDNEGYPIAEWLARCRGTGRGFRIEVSDDGNASRPSGLCRAHEQPMEPTSWRYTD